MDKYLRINQWRTQIVILFGLAFLVACQGNATTRDETPLSASRTPMSASIKVSPMPEKSKPTEPNEPTMPTPTIIPSTPSSTNTPNPSFTVDLSDLSNEVEGTLWVRIQEYWGVDFDERRVTWIAPPPSEDCTSEPLPKSFKLLCWSGSDRYLYDLASKQMQELPLQEADHVGFLIYWSDQLLYSISGSDGITTTYYSYNYITQETKHWASLPDLGLGIPLPSSDGQHWVARGAGPLVEINLDTGKVHPITADSPPVTDNYAWSPVAPMLIYGASDLRPEVTFYANYVYLLDMETNQTVQIMGLPDRNFNEYEWPVWSPNGEKVAILAGSAICVLTVKTLDVTCGYRDKDVPPDTTNYWIGEITWSPSGDTIAFLESPYGDTINLLLFSPETGTFNILIENEYLGGLFWR